MTDQENPKFARPRRASPMYKGDKNGNPEGISFFSLLREDFRSHDRDLMDPGFWAIATHRFGNWRMDIHPKLLRAPFSILYRILYAFNRLAMGIEIPYVTTLGRRVRVWHHGGIFIGARSIGDDVQLRHNTTIGVLHRGEGEFKPVIGNRVDIGPGAVILGGIEVGDDVVIGANSVVVKDVPRDSTVFGVPARPVKLSPGKSKQADATSSGRD